MTSLVSGRFALPATCRVRVNCFWDVSWGVPSIWTLTPGVVGGLMEAAQKG